MVSGDLPRQQSQYLAWLKKTALATALDFAPDKPGLLMRQALYRMAMREAQ